MDTLETTRAEDTLPARNAREQSLVERAEEIFQYGNEPERDNPAPAEASVYSDGYVRLSPPQTYRTPDGYYRALALKAALYAVAAFILLTLALALMRSGVLRGLARF